MSEDILAGRNSVLEAIKSGRSINKIMVTAGEHKGSLREIIGMARQAGIIIQEVEQGKLIALAQGERHQGVVALVPPTAYVELDDIMEVSTAKGEPPFIVLLDGLEDPHNVGAILRTSEATGVHGMLLPKRRSCPLSTTVARTSAGAVEYVPVARIGNVVQTIKQMKNAGLWIVGTDMSADKNFYEMDFTGPVVIVVGSEGQGMGHLIKQECDFLVRIPMAGKIGSLNASVACSLVLYEVFRQREMKLK